MERTRRTVLAGAATLAAGGLAGCTVEPGLNAPAEENDGAFTAFYTLEDFTGHVAGEAMSVRNPIPVGEMGHRYEVGNRAQLDAARSAAFVYVDIEGFQNWSRVTADNLRDNHHEVTVVDALEGVDVRDFGARADGGEADGGRHGDDDDHGDPGDGHADDGDHGADQGGHEEGGDDGRTEEEGHGDGGGHGHGGVDPHFWLDPLRAAESVAAIADGLAEADPDNATVYEDNADEYVEELEALHGEFEAALADREADTVVVAGHDSYQYLAARYGFAIHSPVGVSPNVEPGSAEIAETVEVVDEHDLDVVLYDAFGSPTLAEIVVRESAASEAVAVSPLEGTKPDWDDRGWGYVEQMSELNLPAFEAALKAQ